MEDDRLERVVADIVARDPELGRTAESVAGWLTAGEGVEMIDLAGVQRFAWYQLPMKWLGSPDDHRRVLTAAAELFDGLDLPRYAAVCRSPETAEILDAYEVSERSGFSAFRKAYRRSGVDPPDLDDFTWGDVMGLEEANARTATERALEDAMTRGEFTPGRRGWKAAANRVASDALDSPHPTLPGQTYRTAILTERLDSWLKEVERVNPTLHRLRSRHVKRLLHPVPVPADVEARIEPITWLLDRVDEGVQLTQAGYLPPAMVREGWERFSWDMGWTDRPPRSEVDVIQLHELHQLLQRVGAVRRRGRALSNSTKGKQMRADPSTAWRIAAGGLSDGAWPRAVAEVFAWLLLDGVEDDDRLHSQAARIMSATGWRADGEPPGEYAVMSAWWETRRPLMVLGGVERGGEPMSRTTTLTEFGEATLLEQIRVEATGPRSRP